ncbi:MAG: hypothetical protein C6P37_07670 [Caldibacillus debilis]|uniref:Uncharacterized protein n=1 Tax=Caldibacillus debilis TaxID=301148 RepID=A0A3E0K478_9BACI|nr:MAG: hypothetical protein C6P37_07670 [Caldibacillus debilis]
MEKRIFHDFPSFPVGISRGSAASGTGPCYRAIYGKGRIGSEKSIGREVGTMREGTGFDSVSVLCSRFYIFFHPKIPP